MGGAFEFGGWEGELGCLTSLRHFNVCSAQNMKKSQAAVKARANSFLEVMGLWVIFVFGYLF